MPRAPERILIVLFGAIGDVVRAMPLALRVRQGFPRARITWAVEPMAAPLLEGHPAIDDTLLFDRPRGARAFLPFLAEVRRRRFDLVLDLQRHLKSGVVSWASGAPRRVGFHRTNSKEGNWLFNTESIAPQRNFSSKLRQYLVFGDALELPEGAIEFGLAPAPADEARAQALLGEPTAPFAAAFLGSTWESRLWWPDRTAEVLRELAERHGLGAVLLGARAEEGFAEAVMARAPGSRNLVGQTTLRDLVAVFARARVAFGPDCGPMHLAAAAGTPVVSLWGATSPERSAPAGSEDLAIVGPVACHPCYLRRCPVERLCMQQITPATVLARLELALARRAA